MNASTHPNLRDFLAGERMFVKGVHVADHHLAIVASEVVSESWFQKHSPWPQVNVEAIFDEAERVLSATVVGATMSKKSFESLKAIFGSRGLITSQMTDRDFWYAAKILWPNLVTQDRIDKAGGLHDLRNLLGRPSKSMRKIASVNIAKLKTLRPDFFDRDTPTKAVAV